MTIPTGPDGEWTCEGQADLLELPPREDICQAIPPAYTKCLGEQAVELIGRERAA